MSKNAFIAVLSAMVVAIAVASSQQEQDAPEVDEALFQEGQALYETHCASCHMSGGGGAPPTFPALLDNESLSDVELIVLNVHRGQGAMPAFPQLDAEQLAAVATYVRNAWDNEFGGVSVEEVDAVLVLEDDAQERTSVWEGVYTAEQADRGRSVFVSFCAQCHGERGDGAGTGADMPPSPSIVGRNLFRDWGGQSVFTLFEVTRNTMPQINPDSLSGEQYVDSLAHMFAVSGLPAGDTELVPDQEVLERIVIEAEPEQESEQEP